MRRASTVRGSGRGNLPSGEYPSVSCCARRWKARPPLARGRHRGGKGKRRRGRRRGWRRGVLRR
eukprot:scaffold262_cov103-Isochrysis_galbana.AAC.13